MVASWSIAPLPPPNTLTDMLMNETTTLCSFSSMLGSHGAVSFRLNPRRVQGWTVQGTYCSPQLDWKLTVKQGGGGILGMREASLGRPKDEMLSLTWRLRPCWKDD